MKTTPDCGVPHLKREGRKVDRAARAETVKFVPLSTEFNKLRNPRPNAEVT